MAEMSLESARLKLMDILSNYQGFKKITVIVVFDGYLVKGNLGSVYQYNNISVVYTKEAETADHYIERVVYNLPRHYRVRVATSDGLEQLIILGSGATRITAKELQMEIAEVENTIRKRYIEKRPVKNNLLSDNIDPAMREWMENMRRQKGK